FTYNSGAPSIVAGRVELVGFNRTFTIADGPSLNDVVLSANISGAPGSAITKAGNGGLLMSGTSSTYAGINDTQTLTFGATTATTFTLTFNGVSTAAITYSTTAATTQANIQSALDTMLGAGNTLV